MSGKEAVVVQGEASETDSEDDDAAVVNRKGNTGEVVTGEAPETDSENESDVSYNIRGTGYEMLSEEVTSSSDIETRNKDVPSLGSLPPLKVEPLDLSKEEPDKPTSAVTTPNTPLNEQLGLPIYDTLLHRKLRDSNAALLINIHESVEHALNGSMKEMHSANMQMNRSQVVIQDVCQLIRNFSKDLNKVTEKLDVINSTPYIPNITIPSSQTAAESSP